MQFLKRIFDFYLFSNIHVALSGFCLTKVTLFKFNIENSLTPYFVGLSIIISYNFIRFFEIKKKRLNWYKNWFELNKKYLFILSFITLLLLGLVLNSDNFKMKSIVILFPFAFMTFFYVVPLFKIGKLEVSFRNFPFIKIFSIAVAWAGITVLFPIYDANYLISEHVFLEFFQRTLLLISITIPFDIRDVKRDSDTLKTIPQVLGVVNSKLLGYMLLLGFVCIGFIRNDFANLDVILLIIVAMISAGFLFFSSEKRTRYYTAFWVEAIPIIWFILIILFL